MNKFISVILCLLTVLVCAAGLTAIADGEEYEADGLLDALNVIPAGGYIATEQVTRSDFAVILARAVGYYGEQERGVNIMNYSDIAPSHPAAAAIDMLSGIRVLSGAGDGKFYPDEFITYAEANKAVVTLLGYGSSAVSRGGYPAGYFIALPKVTQGISAANDSPVTYGGLSAMLRNALTVEFTDAGGFRGTILELHNVKQNSGLITANYRTALTSVSSLRQGTVEIDGNILFDAGGTNAENLLGYRVKYYYIEESVNNDNKLIYVQPNNNNGELILTGRDIIEYGGNAYTYSVDGGKRLTAPLNRTTFVIYNGAYVTGLFESYVPENGQARLLDNDGDGKYDVAFIDNYDVLVAETFTRDTVYFKNKGANALVFDNYQFWIITDKNGFAVDKGEIKEWNILMVGYDQRNETVQIVYSNEYFEGAVDEISKNDDETQYTVLERVYGVIDNPFLQGFSAVDVGDAYTFYTDARGKVAAIRSNAPAGKRFGYLLNIADRPFGEGLKMRIYTQSGKFETYNARAKLDINGVSVSGNYTSTPLYSNDEVKHQLIRYELNADGEIFYIETAQSPAGPDSQPEGLRLQSSGSYAYKQPSESFNAMVLTQDDTIVFVIPPDITQKEDFSVGTKGYFATDTTYSVQGYTTRSDAVTSEVIIVNLSNTTGAIGNAANLIAVNSVSTVILSDGTETYKVYGVQVGNQATFTLKNKEVLNGRTIGPGDLIRVRTNTRQLIDVVELVYIRSSNTFMPDVTAPAPNPSAGINNGKRFVLGNVYGKNANAIMLSVKPPETVVSMSDVELHYANRYYIYKFDESSQKFAVKNAADIIPYTISPDGYHKALVQTESGTPKTMVLYD
jgi:hypothetical protein